MERSLEAVRFLANSSNRVAILSALIDGEATRRELQEDVGGSRSTVARILNQAQTRGWVDSEGSQYWLTPLGESMVTDFMSYLETVEGHDHLGEFVNYLPPPVFSLDFRHLRDAEIVELTEGNPAAPFTRAMEIYREATEYRGVNSVSLPDHAKVLQERFEGGQLEFQQVLAEDCFETIQAEPDRAEVYQSFTDRVWIYEGVVPINLQIVDDVVLVWMGKSRDEPAGLLVSDNTHVRSWAAEFFEEYRADSEHLQATG